MCVVGHFFTMEVNGSRQVVWQNLKLQKFKTIEPWKSATRGHHMVTNLDLYRAYSILAH